MSHPYLFSYRWLVAIVALVMLIPLGCGDDSPSQPTPEPDPELTLSLVTDDGKIDMVVQNHGGSMQEPAKFVAAFSDGSSDTIYVTVPADSGLICPISNLHGSVTVTNDDFELEATASDVLLAYFSSLMGAINLNDLVPSPMSVNAVLTCQYSTYVNNLRSNITTVQLIPIGEGVKLKAVFANIRGDLQSTSPGLLCADLSGSVHIDSVVVETVFLYDEGVGPAVTLGPATSQVHNLSINISGLLGFLVEYILGYFQNSFVNGLEDAIESSIAEKVGSDLSNLMIVFSGCDQ